MVFVNNYLVEQQDKCDYTKAEVYFISYHQRQCVPALLETQRAVPLTG